MNKRKLFGALIATIALIAAIATGGNWLTSPTRTRIPTWSRWPWISP